MGFFYVSLFIGTVVLFFVNVYWVGVNLYYWSLNGIQFLLEGMNFAESVYGSVFLKWILLLDIGWLIIAGLFLFARRNYKTDQKLNYLEYLPIKNPKISMVLIAFNEELAIGNVVKDFLKQKNVKEVIVVDNNSSDNTVEIATRCGAKVIQKSENKGVSDSIFLGFKKSLESDCNIIAVTESDGTHNAYDLERMTKYLDNCDEVIGTRQIQVLCEKENQNGILHVWGNMFLAKLIQLKYVSLQHMGIVELTDVGCMYRCFRKDALEKIMNEIEHVVKKQQSKEEKQTFSPIAPELTLISIENNLRIVELPVTFKKRIGHSKSQADNKIKAIKYGLRFIWLILSR